MAKIFKVKTKTGETHYKARPFVGLDEKGKPIQLCRTFETAKEAKDWAADQIVRRGRGELVAGKYSMAVLFDDLERNFRNRNKTGWAALVIKAHLRPYFGTMRADQVTTSAIERYVEKRKERGRANGTIIRELTVLKRTFSLAKQTTPPKVAMVPHFPKLEEGPARRGFQEQSEYEAMLAALPDELKPILVLAFHTGMRRGEILGLQWSQVDLLERVIRLEPGSTKNKEGRMIPLASDVLEILRMQRELHDRYHPRKPWVFFRHATGDQLKDFRGGWTAACKKCGLWDEAKKRPTRLLHDLRRTGVRNLIRAGVPERVAMTIGGWKSRSVMDRYNIVSEADLHTAAHRLDGYLEENRRKRAEASDAPIDKVEQPLPN